MGKMVGKAANQLPVVGHLGELAFFDVAAWIMMPDYQEVMFQGTGVSRTVTIRRPYDFKFYLVDSTGSSGITAPSADCNANTDYSLIFTAAAGKFITGAIIPILQ